MSAYGSTFDRAAETWRVIENEHDKIHPDRSEYGGVGGCTMMRTAVDLQSEMMRALEFWRARGGAS